MLKAFEFAVNGPNGGTSEPISDPFDESISRQSRIQAREAIGLNQQSPKKRKADGDLCFPVYGLTDEVERGVARALQDVQRDTSSRMVQSLREEVKTSINHMRVHLSRLVADAVAKVQIEADRRTEAVLQRLMKKFNVTLKDSDTTQSEKAQTMPRQKQAQQSTWARVARDVGPQTQIARDVGPQTTGWTTVGGYKTKQKASQALKKHAKDQRRVLFIREASTNRSDPRDVMLEINKALAQAGANTNTAVRLIEMRYTRKGHLSGLVSENVRADDLLEHTVAVTAAARRRDAAVRDVEKTEKWRKLRVHGVSLDRYIGEGQLELAREEIELMTGTTLAYVPRWLNSGRTLLERFDNGSIEHSTIVVTVRSKQAADTMMAKGLSFGGRRHEVEKFWEKGEGGICTHCCGRDHFGKCTEVAKCFVCAEEHEGAEHRCPMDGCGKEAMVCEHQAAKCANCGGKHMATSMRCPEKRQ
jgi:hypothetical protein